MTKDSGILEQVATLVRTCPINGDYVAAKQIDQLYQQRITDAVLKIPGIPHNVVITAIKQELDDE